jgi:hypothetical protein
MIETITTVESTIEGGNYLQLLNDVISNLSQKCLGDNLPLTTPLRKFEMAYQKPRLL